MATNSIGKGTCNFPLNMPIEERSVWGRLAFNANAKSVGSYIRELALKALESQDKTSAEVIAKIRKQRMALVMLIVGMPLILAAEFNHSDLRRNGRCQVA